MRHEKAEALLGLALALQATRTGLSLDDIAQLLGASRRTAERMRDAVARVFPQFEQANPGELPKRWRLPGGTLDRLVAFTAEEIAQLATARDLMRRAGLESQADLIGGLADKLRALMKPEALRRIEPDLEALAEARGLAMRPGPRPRLEPAVMSALETAILACRKVRLHYRARETGALSRQVVCPYGFLYGHRHYLVAYAMNRQVRDYRLYSLADISRAEITEWPFRRRDFSLDAYASRSFGVFQEPPVEVVWKFSPRAAGDARACLFHPTQRFEEQPDGSLIVRFRAGGLREMCWHLFTWGDAVEVIAPDALRCLYADCLAEAARALWGGNRLGGSCPARKNDQREGG